MSYTTQLLRLMSDGKSRSIKKMAEELGCTVVQAHDALHYIRKYKATRSLDTHYEITPQGRMLLHRREGHKPAPVMHLDGTVTGMVAQAISNQPALVQAWR